MWVLLLNKITKLKAIHNCVGILHHLARGAFTEQNYKIESNSQLDSYWYYRMMWCFY